MVSNAIGSTTAAGDEAAPPRLRRPWFACGAFLVLAPACIGNILNDLRLFFWRDASDATPGFLAALSGLSVVAGGFCVLYSVLDRFVLNRGVPVRPQSRIWKATLLMFLLAVGVTFVTLMTAGIGAAQRAAEKASQEGSPPAQATPAGDASLSRPADNAAAGEWTLVGDKPFEFWRPAGWILGDGKAMGWDAVVHEPTDRALVSVGATLAVDLPKVMRTPANVIAQWRQILNGESTDQEDLPNIPCVLLGQPTQLHCVDATVKTDQGMQQGRYAKAVVLHEKYLCELTIVGKPSYFEDLGEKGIQEVAGWYRSKSPSQAGPLAAQSSAVQAQPATRQSPSGRATPPAQAGGGAPAEAPAAEGDAFDPLPEVDEQLFLIRKADATLGQVFEMALASQDLGDTIARHRRQLVLDKEFADARQMLPEVIQLHSVAIEFLDAYSQLLVDLDVLEKEFLRQRQAMDAKVPIDGFVEGGQLGGGLALAGVEPVTAALVIGGAILKNSVDLDQQQQEMSEAQHAARARREKQYLDEQAAFQAKMRLLGNGAAEKLGCKVTEAGFDLTEDEISTIQAAIQQDDLLGMSAISRTLIERRPRDPFLYVACGIATAEMAVRMQSAGLPSSSLALVGAEDLVRASRLVPRGTHHDDLRAQYLLGAAAVVTMAMTQMPQSNEKAVSNAGTLASRLLDKVAEVRPRATIDNVSLLRAYVLAKTGEKEAALAIFRRVQAQIGEAGLADPLWTNVLSLVGESAAAWARLKVALASDEIGIREVLRENDFASLVQRYKDEVHNTFVDPPWRWHVKYGVLWNSLDLTNEAGLPLRNAVLRATWVGRDGAKHTECYWCPELAAGKTTTYQGVFNNATQDTVDRKACTAALCHDSKRPAVVASDESVCGRYAGVATRAKQDGSDVGESAMAALEVSMTPDDTLLVRLRGGDGNVTCDAGGLSDGVASAEGQNHKCWVAFDGARAFGYFQTAQDIADGCVRAFWVERE